MIDEILLQSFQKSELGKGITMRNQVQLITYVDRLSGGGFNQLNNLLKGPLADVFGGAHLLPFFALFHPFCQVLLELRFLIQLALLV